MSAAAFDVFELLRVLNRDRVDYVIIGGIAVQAHGHRRTTKDLDVIAEPTSVNLGRLQDALVELDARPRDLPEAGPPTLEQLETAAIVPPLSTRHGSIHILRDVPGAPSYQDLRERALVVEVEGLELRIAGLDDLIAMKREAGRPGDLEDLAVLTAIGARKPPRV